LSATGTPAAGCCAARAAFAAHWTLFAASCHCPAVADHRAHPRLLRTIRKFVAYRGAAGKDAERHLSAIRYAHLCHGLPDPTSAEVNSRARLAAEGITRSRELSRGVKKAAPATTQMLAAMQTIYRKGKSDSAACVGALAALAAAVAAFAGCLRLGAVIPESPAKFLAHRHWRMRDLTFDKEQVTISLRSSKTEVVTAVRLTFEATGSGLCPVRLLRMVSERNRNQDPDAPLFQRHDGKTVVKRDVQRALCTAAVGLRRPAAEVARLTGHSFRVGMVHARLARATALHLSSGTKVTQSPSEPVQS
jgi:hypothetical protein